MLKTYNTISKQDLSKYNWFYANIIMPSGERIEWWKIHIWEKWDILFLSYNENANWWWEIIAPFKYSYILYTYFEKNEEINNDSFQFIEIH